LIAALKASKSRTEHIKENTMKLHHTLIAIAGSALLATGVAQAADPVAGNAATSTRMTDRQMLKSGSMKADREQLQQKLRAGKNRMDYQKILKDNGYRISAINEDKKDYVEYEVVKAGSSFEVQMDFDNGATRATKVEVEPNMWRAGGTERMMKDEKYMHKGPLVADTSGRYSDRRYMQGWTDEKDRLEKALPMNLKAADYRSKIEALGYKVTAVNDRERDYVEYEIVKGENSYEVQIDLDSGTGMAKKIDVTSNLWEAEATDRATDRAKDMKK
jgi:opacity protein-like surface antigen